MIIIRDEYLCINVSRLTQKQPHRAPNSAQFYNITTFLETLPFPA